MPSDTGAGTAVHGAVDGARGEGLQLAPRVHHPREHEPRLAGGSAGPGPCAIAAPRACQTAREGWLFAVPQRGWFVSDPLPPDTDRPLP